MSKHVLAALGVTAMALCGCNGPSGSQGNASAGAAGQAAQGSDDFNQAGQLNSGMDPALVPDNTSGATANDARPR